MPFLLSSTAFTSERTSSNLIYQFPKPFSGSRSNTSRSGACIGCHGDENGNCICVPRTHDTTSSDSSEEDDDIDELDSDSIEDLGERERRGCTGDLGAYLSCDDDNIDKLDSDSVERASEGECRGCTGDPDGYCSCVF